MGTRGVAGEAQSGSKVGPKLNQSKMRAHLAPEHYRVVFLVSLLCPGSAPVWHFGARERSGASKRGLLEGARERKQMKIAKEISMKGTCWMNR